jgi:hypothetical protein
MRATSDSAARRLELSGEPPRALGGAPTPRKRAVEGLWTPLRSTRAIAILPSPPAPSPEGRTPWPILTVTARLVPGCGPCSAIWAAGFSVQTDPNASSPSRRPQRLRRRRHRGFQPRMDQALNLLRLTGPCDRGNPCGRLTARAQHFARRGWPGKGPRSQRACASAIRGHHARPKLSVRIERGSEFDHHDCAQLHLRVARPTRRERSAKRKYRTGRRTTVQIARD